MRMRDRFGFCGIVLGLLLLAGAGRASADDQISQGIQVTPQDFSRVKPLADRATLHIAVSNSPYTAFLQYGIEKGYFARANLDIQTFSATGAAVAMAPMLARGDLDIAPQTPSPSLFNLASQGFGVKVIMASESAKPDRIQDVWLLQPKDKAGQIKDFKDLKGKTIEAAVVGSGIDFLVQQALKDASLDPNKDVKLLYRNRSAADFLTLAKAHDHDVIGIIEPIASQAEKMGYDVRWKSMYDIAPWSQDILLVASQQALDKKPEAIRKFLEVYLLIVREIDSTSGKWPDDIMALTMKLDGLPRDFIEFMGGVPYTDPNGEVSMDALSRMQQLWLDAKVTKQAVDLNQLVDPKPIEDALQVIGRAK